MADAKLAVEALTRVAKEMTIGAGSPADDWSKKAADYEGALPPQDGLGPGDHRNLQRVFKELNEFFDPDTIFVTAIGLYQILSGQFQEIQKPYTYFCCGQAGPLGLGSPAACMGMQTG